MPTTNRHEQQFLKALEDIFVGAKIEGESGYINLMRIKSRYYSDGVFPHLMRDIDAACRPFDHAFREELFDKLHDFFSRYFSESGSIYFRHTAYHHNVYERVYTDDRDVMLFWKTHMLYYVKTDRLFNSMEVEVDGVAFRFDVGDLEHKRSNEKRDLVYSFKSVREGKVVLAVAYSERGRKTASEDILKEARKKGIKLNDETLTRATRVFEKQSEVDYFINKNARAFLREQFDLWLYQYVFSGDTEWKETRLRQLGVLKAITYQIIDFIAQFEDELVRVWNKPKFVLNAHYVVTLDKISDPALLARLPAHDGMAAQVAEWRALGMVDEAFTPAQLNITGGGSTTLLSPQYRFLPLDTRYFPDLELDILALFDDLDAALDGWLVHSENYQALNTLREKFLAKVNCVYIDPPYNTNASEINYENRYKHSSWLSLMNDRIRNAVDFMGQDSILCVAIDDFELPSLQIVLGAVFGEDMHLATSVIRSNPHGRAMASGFSQNHEYAIYYGLTSSATVGRLPRDDRRQARYPETDNLGTFTWMNLRKSGLGSTRKDRPRMFYPMYVSASGKVRVTEMTWSETEQQWQPLEEPKRSEVVVLPVDSNGNQRVWNMGWERARKEADENFLGKIVDGDWQIHRKYRPNEDGALPGTWWDDSKYSATESGTSIIKNLFGERELFSFPKSVYLVEDSLRASNCTMDTISLDFFAGSGTTAHAVINLNRADGGRRKYILVEMGEHFNTVILPRVKKVVYSDKWKDGRALPGQGISHFVKYYDLEQYEDTLRRAHYDDFPDKQQQPLLHLNDPDGPYAFLRDLRLMKDTVELDAAADRVTVRLGDLYANIDLAETLSNATGKGIRRITREAVEFQDGTSASLAEPDWELLRPLLWW